MQQSGNGSQAITTSQLVKKFGSTVALNGLDLSVQTGEIHGFLGPNGAGKSTTIRVLLGLQRHNSGTVQVLGLDPWHNAVALHKRLAYIPGEVNLWPNLTGGETIDFLARLRGHVNTARRDELVKRFELDTTKKFRTYSKGNRQKVAIVAALASDVDLYLLDEPTSGLDPLMESVFQQTIKEIKAVGKTVLLSSHILAEVEALCDTVSIIREGKIVESGTLAQLRHLTRTSVSVITDKPITGLENIQGVHDVTEQSGRTEFEVDTDHIGEVLKHITQFNVRDLVSTPPTLEELFMRHYGESMDTIPKAEQV